MGQNPSQNKAGRRIEDFTKDSVRMMWLAQGYEPSYRTIFTTNVNFKSWEEIFPEPKLANAILDRILHHASVVTITGDSYRIKQHLEPENE